MSGENYQESESSLDYPLPMLCTRKNLFLVTSILELGPEFLNLDLNKWYRLPWHSNAVYNTN